MPSENVSPTLFVRIALSSARWGSEWPHYRGRFPRGRNVRRTFPAVRDMISFFVDEKHLSCDEAYMLTNVAVDVDITPARGWNVGVHAVCPKNIFK